MLLAFFFGSAFKLGRSLSFFLLLCGQSLFGSSKGAETSSHLDWFLSLAHLLGIPLPLKPIVASLFTLVVCLIFGLYFKKEARRRLENPVPKDRFGFFEFFETLCDFVFNLSKEQCGTHFMSYLPLLGGLFIFILLNNLIGLVPGFPPATEVFSANLSLGLVVFISYNFSGFKENGLSYLKHFTGPFLILAPLFIVLELISHCARPLSLAFRLSANIFGDHLLLGVFSHMVPFGVPALLMAFGLLVAFIQSFVFTVLTSIYINMALSHDH